MSSIRDIFVEKVNWLGALVPVKWLMSLARQQSVLPFYHAVSEEKILHIAPLYHVKTPKQFISDLDFLLKYFTPVDHFQFKSLAASNKKLNRPVFLLSFDDGLREFHDVIAPILLKKGIPALCFLNSAFIDNNSLFYKYKAAILVSHLKTNTDLQSLPAAVDFCSRNSIIDIQSWLLSVDYKNAQKLDEFAGIIGVNFNDYLRSAAPYLTSPQIKKLIDDGFHFGAHSIDHPEYRFLPLEEQLRQTVESVDAVCERFSLNYRLFSFPFTDHGVSNKFFDAIRHRVDMTFGSAGMKMDARDCHFQRVAFERKQLGAADILKSELLYSAMQKVVGKNVVSRS